MEEAHCSEQPEAYPVLLLGAKPTAQLTALLQTLTTADILALTPEPLTATELRGAASSAAVHISRIRKVCTRQDRDADSLRMHREFADGELRKLAPELAEESSYAFQLMINKTRPGENTCFSLSCVRALNISSLKQQLAHMSGSHVASTAAGQHRHASAVQFSTATAAASTDCTTSASRCPHR